MNLQTILNKTKSHYISVSNSEGEVIDAVEREAFDQKKEISSGGNFFMKTASDYFTKVLNEKDVEKIILTSENISVLFIKDISKELLFSIYSKNEINPNIIKIIIEKYDRNN